MEFLFDIGLFAAKLIVVLVFIAAVLMIVIGMISCATSQGGGKNEFKITITELNKRWQATHDLMTGALLDKAQLKLFHKQEKSHNKKIAKQQKKEAKLTKKIAKTQAEDKPTTAAVLHHGKSLFVIDFKGDIHASQVKEMREAVTAVLSCATSEDEILLRLESPGGMVPGYGLAAAQLQRIKSAGIPLTCSIDKVAASGGYLMACLGDTIISSPFAIVGSIGVVAQMPNFYRLLKKMNVDIELHTAGRFKRTLTVIGKNTAEGREKFKQDLEEMHVLFKEFVQSARPTLDIETVATGEYWYGKAALDLHLVDTIQTSDEYILTAIQERKVLHIDVHTKKSLSQKLGRAAEQLFSRVALKLWQYTYERQLLNKE